MQIWLLSEQPNQSPHCTSLQFRKEDYFRIFFPSIKRKNVLFIFKQKGSSKKSRYVVKSTPILERKSKKKKKSATVQSTRQCKHPDITLPAPLLPLCGFLFWHNRQYKVSSLVAPPGGNVSKKWGVYRSLLLCDRLPQNESSDGKGLLTISSSAGRKKTEHRSNQKQTEPTGRLCNEHMVQKERKKACQDMRKAVASTCCRRLRLHLSSSNKCNVMKHPTAGGRTAYAFKQEQLQARKNINLP